MNTCLKFKKYVILLLAIGAFIGCSKDDDDPQPSSSSNNNPTTKEHFTYKLNGEMTNATDSAFLFIYNNSASISTTEGGGFPKHDIFLSFTDTLSEGTYKLGDGNFTAFINKKFDANSSNNYPVFDATLEIESNSVSSGQRAIKAKFNLSGVYFLTQDTIKVTEGSFYLKEEGFMLN